MDEPFKLAFTFAKELTTQLITLATAIITVTATFARDHGRADRRDYRLLMSAWILYVVSMLFGIATWMALTGALEQAGRGDAATVGFPPNLRWFAGIQIIVFFLATGFLLRYAAIAIKRGPKPPDKPRREWGQLARYRRRASDWLDRH